MSCDEFVEPDGSDFLHTFGVERTPIPGEGGAFRVEIEALGDEGSLTLTYDVLARSAQLVWTRSSREVVRIFRESVDRIDVDPRGAIRITSGTKGFSSVLTVDVYPVVGVTDTGLMH